MQKKKSVLDIQKMKQAGERIAMLTSYDYPTAGLLDGCGIDMILVGDSVGVVVAGHDNTLPVTMQEMIYHTKAVMRATPRALVVADLPYLSYQTDLATARHNAGLLIKEGGAAAVKLEGGAQAAECIAAICDMGIPVMGHIGLTPQSLHQMGGYRVQGKGERQAERVLEDARAVERAGAFAVVLEGIPMDLARRITAELAIPTIGIGAGPQCDGQVLVLHDILGLCSKYAPRFVKRYADLAPMISGAVTDYITEVKRGSFPEQAHCFT